MKTAAYAVLAFTIGLLLVLLPLVTSTQIRNVSKPLWSDSFTQGFKAIEDNRNWPPQEPSSNIGIAVLGIGTAAAAYILAKRRLIES